MNAPPLVSALRWENAFFAFLRAELAPSPTRWRDALRLTLLCAVATTFIIAFHLPYGDFLIIFFFAVSQPDAWASLRKARLRGVGTLVGGGLAIIGIVACADKPWLLLVAQAALFAAGLFLARTTTIPYAVMLALFTYVIAMPEAVTDPQASLATIFWRILLTSAGAVIGTIAQLVLWPEPPEKLLLRQLVERLATAESILAHLANDREAGDQPTAANASASVAADLAGQLDLLASAEAGSPWLRQRHAEQIKLITDLQMVLVLVLRLARLAREDPAALQTDSTRARLHALRRQLAGVRRALVERSLPAPAPANRPAEKQSFPALPALSTVTELERILGQMPASLAFLAATQADWRHDHHLLDPLREPLVRQTIFTPDCRLSNLEVVRFALKGSLAATICYLIYQALNWPGISTCVVTTLLCAQSSFGAGLKKSLLRLAGAALGALVAVAMVVTLLPALPGAASYIVATSALFFAAAWLTVGGSRISYIGMQAGLVFALVLLNQPNQSVDLGAAGDRILGVLLGITVLGFIDLTLWPNFAGAALRRKLAETSRALALIPRHLARQSCEAAGVAALAVPGQLAGTLALFDEGRLEFGSPAAGDQREQDRLLALIHCQAEVFQALQVMLRHRQAMPPATLPTAWQQPVQTIDEAIARLLEALASPPGKLVASDLDPPLWQLLNQLQSPTALAETSEATRCQLAEYASLSQELVAALHRLVALQDFVPGATLQSSPEHQNLGIGT